MTLNGQRALVTGGNGGIGLGMALALAEAGADIAIWGRDHSKNQHALGRLRSGGRQALAVRCDVTDERQVTDAVQQTIESLGGIDIVFANAGIATMAPFLQMTLAEWRRVLNVNLDGTFLTLRECARHMVERGEGGAMIVVSSVAAIDGAPRLQHYAASKAGLLGLMRSLAVELAPHRIRVNALLPGWTETDMNAESREHDRFVAVTTQRTPAGRWATPADLGPVACYLADKTVTFHTGDTVVVDGGYSIF